MTKKKICMLTLPNLNYDSRILNEAASLSHYYDVTILTPKYHGKISIKNPHYRVKWIPCPVSLLFLAHCPPILKLINLFLLRRAAWRENPDYFHAHNLYNLICVYPVAKEKRKPIIYDSHELWTDVALFGAWKLLKPIFGLLERIFAPKVEAIITVNDILAQKLRDKYHKPTLSLYNYPVLAKSKNASGSYRQKYPEQKTIVYIGTWRAGRALEQILAAARTLDESYKFIFVGYGAKGHLLYRAMEDENLKNKIIVTKVVSPDRLIEMIRNAWVGLCLIENVSKSYYWSSPTKMFQYIAAEVPILGSNFPEFKKVITKNQIGEVIDPSDAQQIAKTIKKMVKSSQQQKYRRHLKGLAEKQYQWALEEKKLIKFYGQITQ